MTALGQVLTTEEIAYTILSQIASVTVASTAAETTLVSGTLPVLTANTVVEGTIVRIRASGIYSTHSSAPTINMRIKIGSTTLLATGANTAGGTSLVDQAWELEAEYVFRGNGAANLCIGQGVLRLNTSATASQLVQLVQTSPTAIDTTAAQNLNVTAQFGTANAANSITCTNLTMEFVGAFLNQQISYLLRDEFNDQLMNPLSSPRTANPGAGTLTLVQTDGILALGGGNLAIGAQGSATWGEQGWVGDASSRAAGRTLFLSTYYIGLGNSVLGWHTSNTLPGGSSPLNEHGYQTAGSIYKNQSTGSGGQVIYAPTLPLNTYMQQALTLRNLGAFFWLKLNASWELIWVDINGSTATLYPMFNMNNNTHLHNYVKVRDVRIPLNADYGIANFDVTSFTQALGSELLTNGDFSSWSGGNPVGWSITESPPAREISQSGSTSLVVNDGSGSLAQTQSILTTGAIYEASIEVVAISVVGNALLQIGDSAANSMPLTSVGVKTRLDRAKTANFYAPFSSNATNLTVDNVSVKRLTINDARVTTPDGIHILQFTLPSSPLAGQEVHLLYRIPTLGDEFNNGWDAYVRRNDGNTAWDFRLDSIASNTRTNRISVTGVGSPTAIAVMVSGITHECYTFASGTWEKRGSPFSLTLYNTATGVNTIHSTGFTLTQFTSYPRRSLAIDQVMSPNYNWVALYEDRFYTNRDAPLGATRTSEPTGTLNITDASNRLSVYGGAMQAAAATYASGDPRVLTATLNRVAGRTLFVNITPATIATILGIGFTNSTTITSGVYLVNSGELRAVDAVLAVSNVAAFSASVTYQIAIVMLPTGFLAFIRGGAFVNWTLLWRGTGDNTNMAAGITAMSAAASGGAAIPVFRVIDLNLPFVEGFDASSFNVNTFTQSAGSELITNGNFSSWSGDDPTGWTVTGEVGSDPALHQVATNEGRLGVGTGAANFYSSATNNQPTASQTILAANVIYETSINITNFVAGAARLEVGNTNLASYNTTGIKASLARSSGTQLLLRGISFAPIDVTVDDASVKALTLNAARTSAPDGKFEFFFTLPVSPVAGQEIHVLYRMPNSGDEFLNGWDAYLRRNDGNTNWDFRADSIVAGTRTNRVSSTSVGAPTAIRVEVAGFTHDYSSLIAGVWTRHGSTVSVNLYNAATYANTIYSTGTTPVSFVAYPLVSNGTFYTTAFTQSIGSELLTNADLSAWSGDNPTGWTVVGEVASDPMVTEVAAGGGAGTGAARLVSSATSSAPTIRQNILSSNFYEFEIDVSARSSGTVEMIGVDANFVRSYTSTGVRRSLGRLNSSGNFVIRGGTAPSDFTIDDASVKLVTINSAKSMTSDSVLEFFYTLPSSPIAGQEVHMNYRINAAGDEFYNCWDAYIRRNDSNTNWDFLLDSIATGTRTNRSSVTSIGTSEGIRVIVNGSNHDCFTRASEVWTKRGSTVSVSLYNSAVLCNAVYSANVIANSFAAYPNNSIRNYGYTTTQFQQLPGSNLVTNGDFAIALPANWNAWNTPTTFEIASGRLHIIGDAALDGFTNNLAFSTNLGWYEFLFDMEVVSGLAAGWISNSSGLISTTGGISGNRSYQLMGKMPSTGRLTIFETIGGAGEFYVDNVSVRELLVTKTNVAPDSELTFEFTLPTATAGQIIGIVYREEAASGNYWLISVQRNLTNTQWDFRLDSYATYGATNRVSVTNVGSVDAIRIRANGSTHDCFTRLSGAWTKRGSTASVALYNAATTSYPIYSTGTIPIRFTATPISQIIATVPLVNKTSFEQSIGSELLTDGGFETWTSATNLTNYTESINGSSTINRDADVHGGSFALRIDTDASSNVAVATQNVTAPASSLLEMSVWGKANLASKSFRFETNVTGDNVHVLPTAGYQQFMTLAPGGLLANTSVYLVRGSAVSSSMYFDDYSVKLITPTTLQPTAPNGVFELYFTLPVSPIAGQLIMLAYRYINGSNFFAITLRRNDTNAGWEVYLERYVSGARTGLTLVTVSLGAPTGLRVQVINDVHTMQTFESGVWTHRGTPISDTTHNYGIGLTEVHNTGFTPTSLLYYPLINVYDGLSLDLQ